MKYRKTLLLNSSIKLDTGVFYCVEYEMFGITVDWSQIKKKREQLLSLVYTLFDDKRNLYVIL